VLTSAVWADGLVDNPGGQVIARATPCASCPLPTGHDGALMKIQVRYFASLREALGASEAVDCEAGHAGPAA
jgi:hypothetical protein